MQGAGKGAVGDGGSRPPAPELDAAKVHQDLIEGYR